MNKYLLFILLVFLSFNTINAETYELDLAKSIEIAKEKSFNILDLVQDFKIAENSLKEATSSLKTHIDLNFVAPNYTKSIEEDRSNTAVNVYSIENLSYSAQLLVNQPLITGGRIYLNSQVRNNDNYYEDEEKSSRIPRISTSLGLSQPLTALYGYNSVKSRLTKAKLSYERSKKSLKREELNIVYSVSNAFYSLLSSQKKGEIAKLDLERQIEANEIAQNKFEAGLIKEVDALQMEVDLAQAQNNYEISLINQSSSRNNFKQLIGLETSDSVILNTELKYNVVIVDVEKAVSLALKNRLEIREREIAIEQSKMTLKERKSNGMIQSDLNMTIGKYGANAQAISTPLSTAFRNSYNDFVGETGLGYTIGFTVNIPILDFGENRASVRSAKANLEKSILLKSKIENDIEIEVRDLVANLNSSLSRLQLLEKSVVIAEKSFEITRRRYSDGDIDSQALALERNRMNSAYNTRLSAYVSYQLQLADIMRKTFYDFQTNEEIK